MIDDNEVAFMSSKPDGDVAWPSAELTPEVVATIVRQVTTALVEVMPAADAPGGRLRGAQSPGATKDMPGLYGGRPPVGGLRTDPPWPKK